MGKKKVVGLAGDDWLVLEAIVLVDADWLEVRKEEKEPDRIASDLWELDSVIRLDTEEV
ncbi:hypothetical protein [Thermus albus]|uniref:hypothetical protein n=1 Tax=Thermus albus TaxID=2908146 RepID=UPI001FA9DBE6|nr:hypothetical protein [Thermus albus]